jgi:predicted acetyltransferase
MSEPLSFTDADDTLWKQYDELATRGYGHRVGDITDLREHAQPRVALRGDQVVAGGLGLLVEEYFGGRSVPSACLGAGCVAPEERGDHLATRMVEQRLGPLRERGAVISAISTSSNGYARRLGWQAPAPVFGWAVATDDLKQSFTDDGVQIDHGLTPDAQQLQQNLARQWNGPVSRPGWWWTWKQRKSSLTTYRFSPPGHPTAGLLSLTTKRRERHGMSLIVHDFWAASEDIAVAMLAFLGRHNTRADIIEFRRGALPPYPILPHHHHRLTAQAWHPWMLRLLDIPEAIRRRGWPAELDATVPIEIEIEIENENGDAGDRYVLHITGGSAEISPTQTESEVTLTRGQLAVWYAGGYRTATSARLAGIRTISDTALAILIRGTTDLEPWLPDHF